MKTFETDSNSLRRRLSVLMAEAAKNETILRRAQDRELKLLRSDSLEELFTNLIDGLRDSFGLDQVTVTLNDPDNAIRHLLLFNECDEGRFPDVNLVDDIYTHSSIYNGLRRPILGPFVAADHAAIFNGGEGLRSVAILPLERQSKLIGSINFGSRDSQRFTRHHATDFLGHLAVIAAFCVENAINRSRLIWSGLTDVLTGWHNRRYLNTRLREEIARAQRDQTPLGCIMFDLDRFKAINDQYGHLAGDAALREVARRVQHQIRSSDLAARFGGEEFTILMPDTGIDPAAQIAERIRQCVRRAPIRIDDQDAITVTVSAGAAALVPAPDLESLTAEGERLLGLADAAMYRAKAAGRDRVFVDRSDESV